MLDTTLCLLKKDDKILLAMKKRGFAQGKYNGVGGKIEEGETPEQAMIRETEEEISVTPTKYEKVGFIEFDEFYKTYKEKDFKKFSDEIQEMAQRSNKSGRDTKLVAVTNEHLRDFM